MTYRISRFESISRHQASLSQPPAVIECLTAVLNYIKDRLSDDQNQELTDLIEQHLSSNDLLVHHLNLKKLEEELFVKIKQAFVDLEENHNEVVPDDPEGFYSWILEMPEIYDGQDLPEDYSAFSSTVTLQLVLGWINSHHDLVAGSHPNTLSPQIASLLTTTDTPISDLATEFASKASYAIMDDDRYNSIIQLLAQHLLALPPIDPVIDYWSYPDVSFASLDPEAIDELGLEIVTDYTYGLSEYGETSVDFYHRKYLDYYEYHLTYVLSNSMALAYQNTLTDLRNNVNTSYSKVFFVPTLLSKQGYSISIEGSIDTITAEKTLDIMNLVGLSKSIVAVSLIPYQMNGILKNRLVVSFDNYNPVFTDILIGDLDSKTSIGYSLTITVDRDELVAHVAVKDWQYVIRFANTNRMFDVDPYYLFIPPRIALREPGTIRINRIKLYGSSLSDEGREVIVSGFRTAIGGE